MKQKDRMFNVGDMLIDSTHHRNRCETYIILSEATRIQEDLGLDRIVTTEMIDVYCLQTHKTMSTYTGILHMLLDMKLYKLFHVE